MNNNLILVHVVLKPENDYINITFPRLPGYSCTASKGEPLEIVIFNYFFDEFNGEIPPFSTDFGPIRVNPSDKVSCVAVNAWEKKVFDKHRLQTLTYEEEDYDLIELNGRVKLCWMMGRGVFVTREGQIIAELNMNELRNHNLILKHYS